MKNFKSKLSALALSAVVTMQIGYASIDTGLGQGLGGAVIDSAGSMREGYGLVGVETGNKSATLNFNETTMVDWKTLNLNKGETLNFNAVDGANNLTIVNKVQNGMSKIYGDINANDGISNLVISNPNGVLFDGAHFTTAGDALITSQQVYMTKDGGYRVSNESASYVPNGKNYMMEVKDSEFKVGGDLNFIAPTMNVVRSAFKVGKNGAGNVRFETTNGKDYFVTETKDCNGCTDKQYTETQSMRLEAINVDGNVYIVNDKGVVKTVNGGEIRGNLDVKSNGSVSLNYVNNDKVLHVTGDVNAKANGPMMYARVAKVDGNLNMTNGGGFLEVNDVKVGKDMNLTTTKESENPLGYKHFVHVIGDTTVGGYADLNMDGSIDVADIALAIDMQKDIEQHMAEGKYSKKLDINSDGVLDVADITALNDVHRDIEKHMADGTYSGNATINSENNIHIGNYNYDTKEMLDGHFKVGGTLTAHAKNGHVTTTIDVTADKVNYTSDNYNILASEDALITAKEYSFKSNGYIGAIKDAQRQNGDAYPAAEQIIDIMENYVYIPKDIKSHAYMNIAGGHITNIETPKDAQTYIGSCGDVLLTGANAGDINITALRKKIEITGPDVHANNINVGPETDYLKVDFDGRDYTTNYTNIRDGKVVTIRPDEKITYELADGSYNQPTLKPGERTTYLIGPEKEIEPEPQPQPEPQPSRIKPSNDDNVKVLRNKPDDLLAAQPSTPVAFASDLDDEEEAAAVRKNVDGSVTVVRAFPMN